MAESDLRLKLIDFFFLNLSNYLIYLFSSCFTSSVAPSLIQVSGHRSSSEACCRTKNLLSCHEAIVNHDLITTKESIMLAGVTVSYVSTVAPNGYVYKNLDGDEAIITYNIKTGNVFGSFKTSTGKSYAIEKCGSIYIWTEFEIASFKADSAVETDQTSDRFSRSQVKELRAKATADNVTAATYSVMFYYTPQFEAITSDIPGYIDQVQASSSFWTHSSRTSSSQTSIFISDSFLSDSFISEIFLSDSFLADYFLSDSFVVDSFLSNYHTV